MTRDFPADLARCERCSRRRTPCARCRRSAEHVERAEAFDTEHELATSDERRAA